MNDDYGYSWRNARYGSSFTMPRTEHFGRWVMIAVVMGVVFHGLLYYALEKIPVLVELMTEEEESSTPSKMTMVSMPRVKPIETPEPQAIEAPPEDPLKLAEELSEIEDATEAIITPDIDKSLVDIKFEAPALKGSEIADNFELIIGAKLELDSPEIGMNTELLANPINADIQVDVGQAVADIFDPDKFTDELVKKGSGGESAKGLLEGFTSLEDMKKMSGNALENAKALIGSDLLFAFGKAELKSSARHSLMAVAFLIDKNEDMVCVLNGHTDLIGDEVKNRELSIARAEAVKHWLIKSLLIDPERIVVIGHGMSKPIVKNGDREMQAINRRVVIEMKYDAPELEEEIPEAIPAAIPFEEEVIPRARVEQ